MCRCFGLTVRIKASIPSLLCLLLLVRLELLPQPTLFHLRVNLIPWFTLLPCRRREYTPKRQQTSTILHGVTFQNIVIFIVRNVRASNRIKIHAYSGVEVSKLCQASSPDSCCSGFKCTVQLRDSLGSRRACSCSEDGFSSEIGDRA
jgi:hypothetical protein